MANGMVFTDGWQDLNYLCQKVVCYRHHHDNYQKSLSKNIIPFNYNIYYSLINDYRAGS